MGPKRREITAGCKRVLNEELQMKGTERYNVG
jgi:hypothetical protein